MRFSSGDATIGERHVQALWYDGALRPAVLRTTDGVPLTVIDPGVWNLEAGPDFLQATVTLKGERRCGDVEIHLRPCDWTTHGHARDPAYAGVMLHVTWFGGPPAEGLPEGCASVCLGDALRTRPDFSPDLIDLTAYPYAKLPRTERPCALALAGHMDLGLEALRAAGRRRLALKTRRLKTRLVRGVSHDQVFYEEVFAALGYKYNAFPFREVAAALPWADLPPTAEGATTALSCVAAMRVTADTPWRGANVRPANAPARRLAAAAALFSQGPALRNRLAACDLCSRSGQRAAAAILCEGHQLGMRRAGAILANVIVPFALAEERIAAVPEWIVPEDVSSPVRLTAFRLFGRDHNPALYAGNGLLIQGLLQIYRDYCLAAHPDCGSCTLVAELARASRPSGIIASLPPS